MPATIPEPWYYVGTRCVGTRAGPHVPGFVPGSRFLESLLNICSQTVEYSQHNSMTAQAAKVPDRALGGVSRIAQCYCVWLTDSWSQGCVRNTHWVAAGGTQHFQEGPAELLMGHEQVRSKASEMLSATTRAPIGESSPG